jgi:anthranilate 1,2-dioxygenase small subunit
MYRNVRFLIAAALLCVIATAAVQTQRTTALSATDYAEIQQLYARYAFAYDTAEDDGKEYARTFMSDGAFSFPNGDPLGRCPPAASGRGAICQGPDALAQLARGRGNKNRLTLSHVTTNLVIEPAPGGATGKAYLTLPGGGAGLYEDQLVKTASGWRFKLRAYTPLPRAEPTRPAVPTLTPSDHVDIQQLYAHYAFAYDTGATKEYAQMFTPDGSFVIVGGETYSGHQRLAELASGNGKKHRLSLNHFTTNVAVDPVPDGAVGRAYLAVIDVRSGGERWVRSTGLYEDRLVKTPEGWRFKSRVYTRLPDPSGVFTPPTAQ